MDRIQLQPAYILHQRPWRDSSGLIEAFSRPFGRIGLIARGVRRPNSKLKSALQPFQPVLLSWSGRGDLATLTGAEAAGAPVTLTGTRLLCGFYVNELLIRLLHRHDPHPELFNDYARCLTDLGGSLSPQAALRLFEKRLLSACGYGLNLTADIESGEAVSSDRRYDYVLEQGPRESEVGSIAGASLLALAGDALDDEQALRDAKRLLRAAIDLYLGGKPLKTRQVMYSMQKNAGSGASEP